MALHIFLLGGTAAVALAWAALTIYVLAIGRLKTYFGFGDSTAGLLGTLTLLSAAAGGLAFGVIADGRQIVPPTRLKAHLPSDFDYIPGKALRTEPDERYASVDAFADDVRAFLEWQPVKARSGDRSYRIGATARSQRI